MQMKESMTVTHLRKMHRNGASTVAMERVAGGAHHFRHLDRRYGITMPAFVEDDMPLVDEKPALTVAQVAASGDKRPPGRPPLDTNLREEEVPKQLLDILHHVARLYGCGPDGLSGPRQSPWCREPRSLFVGAAEHLMPNIPRTMLAFTLRRDRAMVTHYAENHAALLGSPEYTVKFEQVVAAMETKQ